MNCHREIMICYDDTAVADRKGEYELCRICFSRRPSFLNVFETFVTNEMTIADGFMDFLGENMFPDDDLPEFICCDCLEEVMATENINENFKAAVRHSVWRLRLLKRLQCAEMEAFTRSRFKLPFRKPEEGQELRNLDAPECDFFKRGCVRKINCSDSQSETEMEEHTEYKYSAFHQCNICSGVFLDSSDLKHHKNMFHSIDESISCGRCWKKFFSWEELVKHIKVYNFQCKFETKHIADNYAVNHIPLEEKDVCQRLPGESDGGNQTLPIHVKKETEYSCSDCDFLSSKSELFIHLTNVHFSVFPIFCRVCRTGFVSRMHLGLHQVSHKKTFFCYVCEREFLTKKYFNKHIKFCQKKIVVNKCKICGMELSTRGNLRLHMTSHSNLRKYECSLCEKTYKLNRHLLKHVRSFHMKLKPFQCHICDRKFTLKGNLKNHFSTHSEERPYPCSSCTKRFKRINAKNVHEEAIHGIFRFPKKSVIVEEHLLEKIMYDNRVFH